MELTKENLKCLPLALYGLAVGIGEVILKPLLEGTADRVSNRTMAAIHYYSSSEEAADG